MACWFQIHGCFSCPSTRYKIFDSCLSDGVKRRIYRARQYFHFLSLDVVHICFVGGSSGFGLGWDVCWGELGKQPVVCWCPNHGYFRAHPQDILVVSHILLAEVVHWTIYTSGRSMVFTTMSYFVGFASGCLYRGSVTRKVDLVVVLRRRMGIESKPV